MLFIVVSPVSWPAKLEGGNSQIALAIWLHNAASGEPVPATSDSLFLPLLPGRK
ncbi:MAG: hypothetical protein WA873_10845 [Jannaschia helgolandensis]